MPAVAIAGAALGASTAHSSDQPMLGPMLWFAAAMSLASYLSAILEAATLAALRLEPEGMSSDMVSFAWDLVLGSIAGILLAQLTTASVLQAAGGASAILFIQKLVLEKLLIGNAIGDVFTGLLQGRGSTSPGYSLAAAQSARGDFAAARATIESEITRAPRDPRPYLTLARMLRNDARDYAGAAETLERALDAARPDERMAAVMLRELVDICLHKLDAPGRAAKALARYIAERPEGTDVAWARATLATTKSMLK